ncbi:MAG: hypothetical protein LQ350_001925 [Teloschistes chrysophthalmus]|nr:MAG: hypothetical protein LQ350_001925 [Niorma chrysophthalma]
MSNLQLCPPEDKIRRSLSPHIPSVPGFTPIDPSQLSVVPFEIGPISVPRANGVNSGKKRSRELSSPSRNVLSLRPPKKAKHTLVPRDDENVAEQSSKLRPLNGTPVRKEYPEDFEPVMSPQPVHSGVSSKCKTLAKSSSSTFQESSSTSPEGLTLAYQTAFRQGEQPRATSHQARLPSTNHEGYQGGLPRFDPSPLARGQTSSTVGTVQACSETASSDYGSALEGFSDQDAPDGFCEVPCSPGVMPDSQPPQSIAIEPSEGPLALERFWPNPYSDVGQVGTPHSKDFKPNIYKGKELEKDVETGSLSHDEARPFPDSNSNVDFQAFDEFLVSDFELDSSHPEVQGANESATLADENLSTADGLHLSYSSDIDLLMAENLSLSSSPSLIESSSPYLQSLVNLPNTSNHARSSSAYLTANERSTEDEDIYNDNSLAMDLLELQLPPSAQRPPPSPPSSPSSRRAAPSLWVPPRTITPDASPKKASMAPPSQAPIKIPHEIAFSRNTGAAISFVRPPFPQGVRDRSPVIGLNTSVRLRTCFRIGEAIRSCTNAFNTRQDVVIELYARVTSSERLPGSVKQTFSFADIFSPARGPYLSGAYNLWKGNGLWDADSKVFLGKAGQGKFARVLGKIVREEMGPGLQMKVLSIWEAYWDDVAMCKGHVFSV